VAAVVVSVDHPVTTNAKEETDAEVVADAESILR
jgi:hypothetical protein